MVSGFLISPNDHDRMSSGLAIEILIWSNAGAGAWVLKRLVISFICSLLQGKRGGSRSMNSMCRPLSPPPRRGEGFVYSAAAGGNRGAAAGAFPVSAGAAHGVGRS